MRIYETQRKSKKIHENLTKPQKIQRIFENYRKSVQVELQSSRDGTRDIFDPHELNGEVQKAQFARDPNQPSPTSVICP